MESVDSVLKSFIYYQSLIINAFTKIDDGYSSFHLQTHHTDFERKAIKGCEKAFLRFRVVNMLVLWLEPI